MSEKTVCPYFEDRFVEVMLPAPLQSRRVPTPICGLAEQLRVRLRTTVGGQEVASVLTMTPANAAARSMYGCDLVPPERTSCTFDRLQTRCEPGFVTLLRNQNLSAGLPVRPVLLSETDVS